MSEIQIAESSFWKQASVQRIEHELAENRIKEAISVAKIALWAHDQDPHFSREIAEVILDKAEQQIRESRYVSAKKLLIFCKESTIEDARTHYFLHLIGEKKGDFRTSKKEEAKAIIADPEIAGKFTEENQLFLTIKGTVIKIIELKNTLVQSVQFIIDGIVEGPGSLHGFKPEASTRGTRKKVHKQVYFKKEDVKTLITADSKNSVLTVSTNKEDVSFTDAKGKKIKGRKWKGAIVFRV